MTIFMLFMGQRLLFYADILSWMTFIVVASDGDILFG
jgi:hypothetical protein